jgi:hypothetical protein
LINQRQQSILTAQPGSDANFLIFRWISIVMQSFFEITVLETVHRNALLPPISKKQKPDEKWSLVRMKARRNLPELLDWSVLSEYAFFVNQAMTARRKPLIAWLEGYVPRPTQFQFPISKFQIFFPFIYGIFRRLRLGQFPVFFFFPSRATKKMNIFLKIIPVIARGNFYKNVCLFYFILLIKFF